MTEEDSRILMEYGIPPEEVVNPDIHMFRARDTLLDDGEPMEDLMFLISGQVKTLIPAQGKAGMTLGRYLNRGVFDDTCLFREDRVSHIRAIAETDVEVIALPYDANARILLEQPAFLRYLATGFAAYIDQAMNSFFLQKYPLAYPVCSYIAANRMDAEFVPDMDEISHDLSISKREIERCFEMLVNKGILIRGKTGYRILDPNRFEEYNKGMYAPKQRGS